MKDTRFKVGDHVLIRFGANGGKDGTVEQVKVRPMGPSDMTYDYKIARSDGFTECWQLEENLMPAPQGINFPAGKDPYDITVNELRKGPSETGSVHAEHDKPGWRGIYLLGMNFVELKKNSARTAYLESADGEGIDSDIDPANLIARHNLQYVAASWDELNRKHRGQQ